ncbi:EamA family transporter [Mesorhizobium qingshengii]|uniref:O-acetylserine/cysteine efflux transporter n=1 Tax=Mesorhizobium qingshengii TaxID=1165689 RepID=A0A1G5ZAB3_9HYPH|nr:EamA family transporter [Mesorhizobium qingshengii]SDA91360.1 O-acetylserine/cysteine efflux transporter [Mesorhizobium qingshengii]
MTPRHKLLGILIAAVWGFNFVVIRLGLESFPPLLLAALRFSVAATAIFIVPKPPLSWRWFILVGMVWFTGQFAFLFVGMRVGMPAGLASVLMQTQVVLTVLLAAGLLGERIVPWQIVGIAVAIGGLGIIGSTVTDATHDITITGLACVAARATSWALGNILVRRSGKVDMLAFVTWLCLVPPLPLLALSAFYEGHDVIQASLRHPAWQGVGAVFFLGFVATTAGFAGWGHLIKQYGAAATAPFALLVPVFGAFSAWFFLGETFNVVRLAGMALIVAGVAVVLLASRRRSMSLASQTN